MKKLREMIEERINKLEIKSVDNTFDELIKVYKKCISGKYENVYPAFYPVFVVLLIATKIGIEKTHEVERLIFSCSLVFSKIIFSNEVYNDYYDSLKKIYDNDHNIKVSKKELLFSKSILKKINKEFDKLYEDIPKKEMPASLALKKLFYMLPDKEIFLSVLSFSRLNKIDNDVDKIILELKKDNNLSVKKRKVNKVKNEAINTLGKEDLDNIRKYSELIEDYYKKISNDIQLNNKSVNRIKRNYEHLLVNLERNKGYIKNIDDSLKLIEDEKIKLEYLKYVINNNSKYEEESYKKNIDLKSKQISNIEIIFNKYGYNLFKLNDNVISNISNIDDLDEKLNCIKNSKFKCLNEFDSLFSLLILNCDIEQLKSFAYLFEQNIVDLDFLSTNILIITNKDNFNNFKYNIYLLNDYIYKVVKYNRNILLIDHNLILKRLKLMNDYYKIEIDKFDKFEFLINDKIFNLLDNFIELGYYEVIYNNPNYLESSNFNAIKRLQIASLLNMDVVNSDNSFIGSIITGNNFYVSDDKLDEFIVDYTDKYVDNNICNIDISDNDYGYLIKLSNYEYDNMTYNINDKLISKNRLLRNIFVLKENDKSDILFEAILLGSINLDDIDISTLSKIVGHKIKTKN